MTDPDVVAELDAELALIEQLPYRVPIHLLAKRARDEIVALRADYCSSDCFKRARTEALEEAAQLVNSRRSGGETDLRSIAHAIRALKDKP